MKCLILAGGSGTRLWPASRSDYPKQFLKLGGEESLLQKTVKRALHYLPAEDILILTNTAYLHDVKRDVPPVLEKNILLEPAKKNTGPAIALAVKYAVDVLGISPDEVLFVCPSDHIIQPEEQFVKYLQTAEQLARKGHIVTFGIFPSRPETGYGYIKKNPPSGSLGEHSVDAFIEKPDYSTAQKYLLSGEYLWNSGMFAFTAQTMLDELKTHATPLFDTLGRDYQTAVSQFGTMPNISIDYAVLEKSNRVVVLPLHLSWSDVGSWDTVYEMSSKDEAGNVCIGNIAHIDTKNCLFVGEKRLVAAVGLEDLAVIETSDVVLITKRQDSQKVKQLVELLQKKGQKEVIEHNTSYRPWGSFTILEESKDHKIKRIVVNPKHLLSLQLHYHRSEHWVVVQGTAKVTIGEKQTIVHENESIFVPKSTIHRVENPGKIPLHIIEIQVGKYLGEDDIVRLEDVYGRLPSGLHNK